MSTRRPSRSLPARPLVKDQDGARETTTELIIPDCDRWRRLRQDWVMR
jgi:hypothetical protein